MTIRNMLVAILFTALAVRHVIASRRPDQKTAPPVACPIQPHLKVN
jgi:hypothetical protein